nr:transposon Ty3-G Gag-Pol polyprotein [Tanacetum cinerariifolium]
MPPKRDPPSIEESIAAMSENISKLTASTNLNNDKILANQAASSLQLENLGKQFENLGKQLATQNEQTANLIATLTQPLQRTTQMPPPTAPPPNRDLQIRPPKLNLPAFDGTNPLDWLFQADQYFSFYNITPPQRLAMVAFYLSGDALSVAQLFYLGLRQDIQQELSILRPHTITQAIGLAKLIEDKSNDQVSTPSSSTLLEAPSRSSKTLHIKRLSPTDMQKRRVEGFCYNCPEKYHPGHKCNPPKFLLLQSEHEHKPATIDPPWEISTVEYYDNDPMDINKMTDTLEPEETGVGGLQLQGKDLVVFRPSERKSLLNKDSYEDVEKSSLIDQDDVGSGVSIGGQNKSRKYHASSGSKTFDSANI